MFLNTLFEISFGEYFEYSRMLRNNVCVNDEGCLRGSNVKGENILVESVATILISVE